MFSYKVESHVQNTKYFLQNLEFSQYLRLNKSLIEIFFANVFMDNLQLGSNLSIDNKITNNLTYLSIPFIAAFSLNCMSVQR